MRLTCTSTKILAALLLLFGASPIFAADHSVLGKSFLVKDPAPAGDPSLRSIVVAAKEPASDDALFGDPLANGATLEIIANGATSTVQTFSLPPGAAVNGAGWKA